MVNKKTKSKKILIVFLIAVLIVIGSVSLYFYNYSEIETIAKNADTTEKNISIIQEFLNEEKLEKEELSSYNCDYEIEEDGKTVKIIEYTGTGDCLVIENEIDDIKVKNLDIEESVFADSATLEMVKITNSLIDENIELENFEFSEALSDDEYTVYITTKEYTDTYLAYQNLSEEEKEQLGVIPSKFEVTLSSSEADILYADVEASSIPSSFDLRDGSTSLGIDGISIGVENQYNTGVCYAYSTLTSVETYISKYFSIDEDFSELHLALLSGQGYAGNFYYSYYNYLQEKYGPIDESFLSMESAYSAYSTSSSSSSVEALTYLYCTSSYSNISSTELETIQEYAEGLIDNKEYDVSDYVEFTTITGDMKSDSGYDDTVEENRQNIKSHILEYGSVFAAIDVQTSSGTSKMALVESSGDYTLYVSADTKDSTMDHAISIIGWDDNYSASNFVDEDGNTPSSNGAWLCLNSWGDSFGDDGCFWISYEDYYIEYYVCGITEVTLEISESNIDVTLGETEYTYDGTEKEPSVTVTFEENTLTKGTDYTITYSNNTNAGTATVTITGIGNYTGTITKEFTINQAENTLKVVAISDLSYTGTAQYLVTESNAQGEVYYSLSTSLSSSNYSTSGTNEIPTATDAGSYTVYYYSPENTNYKEISGSVTDIEISKVDPSYTTPSGLTAVVGDTLGDVTLPSNFTWEDDSSTSVGDTGKNTFTVTYTPTDTTNYNVISGIEVTITVYNELKVSINEYTVSEEDTYYYLEGILAGNTIETVLSNIETNGTITIYDNSEQEITDETTTVTTGVKIEIEKEIESDDQTTVESIEYILVVTGDLNGDGLANSVDLLKLSRYLADLDTDLSGEYLLAANVYKDESDSSSINNADLLKLARVLVSLDEF